MQDSDCGGIAACLVTSVICVPEYMAVTPSTSSTGWADPHTSISLSKTLRM